MKRPMQTKQKSKDKQKNKVRDKSTGKSILFLVSWFVVFCGGGRGGGELLWHIY